MVQGISRAKLENEHDFTDDAVLPILVHGDAAIAGQEWSMKPFSFQSCRLQDRWYIHIVINNQVGFTTSYLQGVPAHTVPTLPR